MKEGPKTLFMLVFGELCRYLFYFGFICFIFVLFWLYSLLKTLLSSCYDYFRFLSVNVLPGRQHRQGRAAVCD